MSSEFQPPLPYRHKAIEDEIRRVIVDDMGHDLKQVAARCDLDYKWFVRALKQSEGRDFLDPETLGTLAAYVTKHHRATPLGWPIVTFEERDRELALMRRSIESALRDA